MSNANFGKPPLSNVRHITPEVDEILIVEGEPPEEEDTVGPQAPGTRLSRSLEMRASFYQTLLSYVQQFTKPEINQEVSRAFKTELASLFESFGRVLRDETSTAPGQTTQEAEDLRKELSQTKDRIIVLLTERAEDQARIARLETELKFLPDLQAQADKALTLAESAGKFQDSLSEMRMHLNNAHIARMRNKLHKDPRRSLWSNLVTLFSKNEEY